MKSTSRAHFLRLYEILEPGWSPRLSPLPLSPLGSFSFTSALVRLQPVEVYHQSPPPTLHLLYPIRVPIQLPLNLVRTVSVRSQLGLFWDLHPHLVAWLIHRSVGFSVLPELLAPLLAACPSPDRFVELLQVLSQTPSVLPD
ncbi:hypothetical protein T06_12729 [Trichinella sp. T6]|nr:hypothetical protein T06_12729 [Trichinella sp. T6]